MPSKRGTFQKNSCRLLKSEDNCTGNEVLSDYSIGINSDFICKDSNRLLVDVFPEIKEIRTMTTAACTEPVYLRDLNLNDQFQPVRLTRTRRYNDRCSDDLLAPPVPTKPSSIQQKITDFPIPTFSVYFQVKRYCKIVSYGSDFVEIQTNHIDPPYIKCPLLLYENQERVKKLKEPKPELFQTTRTQDKKNLKPPSIKEGEKKSSIILKTLVMLKTKIFVDRLKTAVDIS
jgi:hypothetical protein